MPTINRDRDIVRHILRYCEQVDTAHKDFGHSKERFEASTTYQNAIRIKAEMDKPFSIARATNRSLSSSEIVKPI